MNVVVVTPTYHPSVHWGGPTTAMYELCGAVQALGGVRVEVVTTDAMSPAIGDRFEAPAFPYRDPAGYDIYYCRRRLLVSVSPHLLLTAWRRLSHADVVHLSAIYSFPTLPILLMARLLRKPLIWSTHGALMAWPDAASKSGLKAIWRSLCRVLLDKSHSVVHVTSDAEAANARGHLENASIEVIPFGISPPEATPPRRPRNLSLPLALMYLGRLDPIKGIDNLLRALAAPSVTATLDIYGRGDPSYKKQIEGLIRTLGLEGRVSLRGHLDEPGKASAFARTDVLVLPSHSENFGLVVPEALSHGVPVIASTGTPWKELETRGCGLWLSNDPDALAGAITAMAKSDVVAMGEAGRRWVADSFAWPIVSRRIREAYRGLLAEGRPVLPPT